MPYMLKLKLSKVLKKVLILLVKFFCVVLFLFLNIINRKIIKNKNNN